MKLTDFLLKCRMTAVYQPVIIRELIWGDGKALISTLALAIAKEDPHILAYLESVVKRWPNSVLQKHGVCEFPRGADYALFAQGVDWKQDRDDALLLCNDLIAQWRARESNEMDVSAGWGRLRVQMISEHPWCAYCGARPPHAMLDIDHIVASTKMLKHIPKNSRSNLQVLCHRCNRAKGSTYLRSAKEGVEHVLNRKSDCAQCGIAQKSAKAANQYVVVVDGPESADAGCRWVIPMRHVSTPADLLPVEWHFVIEALKGLAGTAAGYWFGVQSPVFTDAAMAHCYFEFSPRKPSAGATPVT